MQEPFSAAFRSAPPAASPAALQQECGKDQKQGDDGEEHPPDGACREVEPEHLGRTVRKERQQAQNGRENGQHYGFNLVIISPYVCLERVRIAFSLALPAVHEIDAGVHRDPAEHHEGGKPSLVEGEIRHAEHQEESDEG